MLQRRRLQKTRDASICPLALICPWCSGCGLLLSGGGQTGGGPVGQLIDMTNRVSLLSATALDGALGALGGGSGVVTGGSDGI